jgi:predicted dehydrogenase
MAKKLKMGMIGGGEGAFIGEVHRLAARIAGNIDFAAGALSSTPEKSQRSGAALGLDPKRVYSDYETMLKTEAELPEGEKIDIVAIVTPNYLHAPQAKMAIEYGFHVICDKPLTATLEDAISLQKLASEKDLKFAVTYTYTGYPLVQEVKEMIWSGEIGTPRKVIVEYLQGWLSEPIENEGQKQAVWRSDPKKSGLGGALGDIGVHAANLVETMLGQNIESVAAYLNKIVPNRQLDDDGQVMLKMESGIQGSMNFSQIAFGEENDLNIRVYGDKASIEWHQMNPNELILKYQGKPAQKVTTGFSARTASAAALTRTPGGHPEGYLEAFANIYQNFANDISGTGENHIYPKLSEGVRGMQFMQAAVNSNADNNAWTKI